MTYRKTILFLITAILFVNITYAALFIPEGQKITNVDVSFEFDSKLNLPTEGDKVNVTFSMTTYEKDIKTNETFYVDYVLIKPDGDFARIGFASFPKGPYLGGKKYNAHTDIELTTPGIWRIYYVITSGKDIKRLGDYLFNSSSIKEYANKVYLHSKEIHVLTFYESNSIKMSNNSFWVSVIGVTGTFLAFFLGLIGNFIIDKYNNSPKIKVTCSPGFVSYHPGHSLHVFNIEAINYGRVAVTLSGVGFDLKKQPNKEKEIMTILKSEVMPFQFPVELMPGKSFTVIKNYKNLWTSLKGKHPTRAFFRDQTDKLYYSKNIKKLFDLKPSNN